MNLFNDDPCSKEDAHVFMTVHGACFDPVRLQATVAERDQLRGERDAALSQVEQLRSDLEDADQVTKDAIGHATVTLEAELARLRAENTHLSDLIAEPNLDFGPGVPEAEQWKTEAKRLQLENEGLRAELEDGGTEDAEAADRFRVEREQLREENVRRYHQLTSAWAEVDWLREERQQALLSLREACAEAAVKWFVPDMLGYGPSMRDLVRAVPLPENATLVAKEKE